MRVKESATPCDMCGAKDARIAELEAENARLRAESDRRLTALIALRDHVIQNATQWEAGTGSHHHPIWRQVSEAVHGPEAFATGPAPTQQETTVHD